MNVLVMHFVWKSCITPKKQKSVTFAHCGHILCHQDEQINVLVLHIVCKSCITQINTFISHSLRVNDVQSNYRLPVMFSFSNNEKQEYSLIKKYFIVQPQWQKCWDAV